MKNWNLDNLDIGMFVIPEGCDVFVNPRQCITLMGQVVSPEDGRFGLLNIPSGLMMHRYERWFKVVEHMNYHDMRPMAREEVRLLVNYIDSKNFYVEPVKDIEQ